MIYLLLTGLSIAALPMILIYILIYVVFLALLFWILSVVPPTAAYARTITLIVGGIILLIFLINLAGGGSVLGR